MSNISNVEAKLPPGFRFHPRDEELVCDYLMKKVNRCDPLLMIEVDLNKCEPWDIPETACVGGKDWYFYSQRDRKYATGLRTNRATASGYWKATGKDRPIFRKGTSLVGMRKTLVFYQGRAPKGSKTDWVVHEFRVEGPLAAHQIASDKEDWVLCRLFNKNRQAVAKPGMGSCYNDDTSSSPLPPLMDSYITFDQTPTNFNEHEQVPCFSIFSQDEDQTNPVFPHLSQMEPTNYVPKATCDFGDLLPMASSLDPFSCDNKVIETVLNHITKTETSPSIKGSPSLGEGSSESYLSEVGIPNMWIRY